MFKYFDLLFIRIYKQWVKWGEKDTPKLNSILTLSFFQAMNILAIYFFLRSLFEKDKWNIPKLHIIIIMALMLLLDYIFFFKIISFDKLLLRYNDNNGDKVILRPWLYILISILILIALRIFHLFPS